MNYDLIKYLIIGIISLINGIVLFKVKDKKTLKTIMVVISSLLVICVAFSKYQYYATDNVNRQIFFISAYNYNEDNTRVSIEYLDDKNETITLDLTAEEVNIQMSNGLGEVEKRNREYKKEIVLFDKFEIPLGSEFKRDDDYVVLNQINFMSEEELNEYFKYMDEINGSSEFDEEAITETNTELEGQNETVTE